jgi:hypothetical protein
VKAVVIYDDVALAAGQRVEADCTRHLVIDGEEYEIDLTAAGSGELDEALAPWIKVGRRPGGELPGKGQRRPDGYYTALREWAAAQVPPLPFTWQQDGRSDYYPRATQRAYDAWLSQQPVTVPRG